MAASCVSVSVSAAGALAATSREIATVRQAGRLPLAAPSVSGVFLEKRCGTIAAGVVSLFGLGAPKSRAGRNAAIAARAADLEPGLEQLDGLDSSLPPPLPQGTKLYVGNLPWSVHSKQLAEVFQEVGSVELVEVIYDRETQKSRGFAFVTMSSSEDAVRAIEKLDGSELDGRVIKVNFPATSRDGFRERTPRPFTPGSSFNSENKMFVGNLSWGVDDDSLESLFSKHGTVVEAKVVYDRTTGRSRGFGFVTLSSSNEVNEAISSLDGVEYDGRQIRVNLAGDKPPPREPRSLDY